MVIAGLYAVNIYMAQRRMRRDTKQQGCSDMNLSMFGEGEINAGAIKNYLTFSYFF